MLFVLFQYNSILLVCFSCFNSDVKNISKLFSFSRWLKSRRHIELSMRLGRIISFTVGSYKHRCIYLVIRSLVVRSWNSHVTSVLLEDLTSILRIHSPFNCILVCSIRHRNSTLLECLTFKYSIYRNFLWVIFIDRKHSLYFTGFSISFVIHRDVRIVRWR